MGAGRSCQDEVTGCLGITDDADFYTSHVFRHLGIFETVTEIKGLEMLLEINWNCWGVSTMV